MIWKAIAVTTLALMLLTSGGCQWLRSPPTLPNDHEVRQGPLRLHSDFALPERNLLVENLVILHRDVSDQLELPFSDREVHVYLFEKRQRFNKYIEKTHPTFPDRRAFFVRNGDSLVVYAHWSERVAEDLRHEVTHAYLNAVTDSIPLWIDEGLAEYFEVPPIDAGFHPDHVRLLQERWADGSWQPNLRRLEGLSSSGQMQLIDYAEAWLWMHWMLKQDAVQKRHLVTYLQAPPEHRQRHPLSESLPGGEAASVALTRHLEHLIARQERASSNIE